MAQDLQKIADELFKTHPKENKVFISENGQAFFSEGDAKNYKGLKNIEYKVFFREGVSDENDSDLEEILQQAEENIQVFEKTLEAVIDISNTEADEVKEAPEDAHEAVKAITELRQTYEENKASLDEIVIERQALITFFEKVSELVKSDNTKLAGAIKKLISENTAQ